MPNNDDDYFQLLFDEPIFPQLSHTLLELLEQNFVMARDPHSQQTNSI